MFDCPLSRKQHIVSFRSHNVTQNMLDDKTLKRLLNPGRGILPEKFGGGVWTASHNLFDTLLMTVAAGTIALNIIHEGLLWSY